MGHVCAVPTGLTMVTGLLTLRRGAGLTNAAPAVRVGVAGWGLRFPGFQRRDPGRSHSRIRDRETWERPPSSGATLLGLHIGAEDGVHSGKVALATRPEPFNHIAIEPQMNGSFARRQDDARGFPEVFTEGFGLGRVGASRVFAACAEGLNLAKGISHDSRLAALPNLPSARR